jgi:hypothetical protein
VANSMPRGEFEALEGTLKISEIGGQVTIEHDGDCWYSCFTLNQAAAEGLADWLTLYRLARQK